MLISSENTLTDTLRYNVLLAIWASLSLVILTYKINHHRYYIYPKECFLSFSEQQLAVTLNWKLYFKIKIIFVQFCLPYFKHSMD